MATLGIKRDIEMTMITSTHPREPLLNKTLVDDENNKNYETDYEVVFLDAFKK